MAAAWVKQRAFIQVETHEYLPAGRNALDHHGCAWLLCPGPDPTQARIIGLCRVTPYRVTTYSDLRTSGLLGSSLLSSQGLFIIIIIIIIINFYIFIIWGN
jgi:hypothetical protein